MNTASEEVKELAYAKIAQIKIYHLHLLTNIIDVAMSRGAFKGSEASQIGALYDTMMAGITQACEAAEKEVKAKKSEAVVEQTEQTVD